MLKSIVKIVVFVLLCFGFIELSYRFVASGFIAFNPVRFNSMNVILKSGLVQDSDKAAELASKVHSLNDAFFGCAHLCMDP